MTSKIFKSSYMSDSSRLEIETSITSASFHITHCTVVSEKSFMFDNTTAPALALAILEAAGVEPDREPLECQVSLGTIVVDLQETIQYQEALASANREQAELEAEALELANAFNKTDWDFFPCNRTVEAHQWLAVARKAREMRKS